MPVKDTRPFLGSERVVQTMAGWGTGRRLKDQLWLMTQTYTVEPVNPLLTIGNSLKRQKSLYKVLTPSINPHINSYGLMGAHDAYMHHWLVKG